MYPQLVQLADVLNQPDDETLQTPQTSVFCEFRDYPKNKTHVFCLLKSK